MQLIIGFILGALVVAFYPDAGRELRAGANSLASSIEEGTQPDWVERIDDLRK